MPSTLAATWGVLLQADPSGQVFTRLLEQYGPGGLIAVLAIWYALAERKERIKAQEKNDNTQKLLDDILRELKE